jgi:hypothetical protein
MWWYAINEGKLAPATDMVEIRGAFPNIMSDNRDEQKRRLRRTVEKYRDNKDVLADPRTEKVPLFASAAIRIRTDSR